MRHGKIFLRCVTLSNWKGKAANAMQRVLQDVLYRKGAKQLERKNCKRKSKDILTMRDVKQLDRKKCKRKRIDLLTIREAKQLGGT